MSNLSLPQYVAMLFAWFIWLIPAWIIWKFYQVLTHIAENLAGIRQTLEERPRT
jgi:hypothetical protein